MFFRLLKYYLNVFLHFRYTVLHLPFNTTCKDFHFSAQIPAMLNNYSKQYYVHLLHSLLCIQYSILVTDPGLTSKPLLYLQAGEKKNKIILPSSKENEKIPSGYIYTSSMESILEVRRLKEGSKRVFIMRKILKGRSECFKKPH